MIPTHQSRVGENIETSVAERKKITRASDYSRDGSGAGRSDSRKGIYEHNKQTTKNKKKDINPGILSRAKRGSTKRKKRNPPSFFKCPKTVTSNASEDIVTKDSSQNIDTTPASKDMTRTADDSELSKTFDFSFGQDVESDDFFSKNLAWPDGFPDLKKKLPVSN